MSSRAPLVHPFTFFLVDGLRYIYQTTLEAYGVQGDSYRGLYWLILFLDKKGQDKLEKLIFEMEEVFDQRKSPDRNHFKHLLSAVMKELHEEGYFLAAKMRPPTREKSLRDLELTVDVAKYGKDRKGTQ